jgi:hypothetical protein
MIMRRGQAALEFIMTYGWAILVVLVLIGALAYMGVVNPKRLIPESCVFSTGITCKDYILTQPAGSNLQVRFTIENNLGKSIILGPVNVSGLDVGGGVVCTVPNTTLSTGDSVAFDCTINGASPGKNQPAKVAVNMSYRTVPGTYYHGATGEILSTVQ